MHYRFTNFFSGISMEVYLSHMAVFRAVEKMGLNTRFGSGWMQYGITVAVTAMGAMLFSAVAKHILAGIGKRMQERRGNR